MHAQTTTLPRSQPLQYLQSFGKGGSICLSADIPIVYQLQSRLHFTRQRKANSSQLNNEDVRILTIDTPIMNTIL
jgi:hypothetical protein